MVTKEYEKECTFCKQKIRMIEKDGKWKPFNLNNGPHDCRDRDRPKQEKAEVTSAIKPKQETSTQSREARITAVIKTIQLVLK
jgi:hypothetical protein